MELVPVSKTSLQGTQAHAEAAPQAGKLKYTHTYECTLASKRAHTPQQVNLAFHAAALYRVLVDSPYL